MSDVQGPSGVVQIEADEWPCGISDGLSLACPYCGEVPMIDYGVSDETWGAVVPREHRRGVVCLRCFDRLAAEKGEDIAGRLHYVQVTGTGWTTFCRAGTTYRYPPGHEPNRGSRP